MSEPVPINEPVLQREPSSTIRVAFKDCDAFGLLYNTRYLDYIMDARAEHLITCYDLDFNRQLQQTRHTWIVQGHQIEYIAPAKVHEEVTIRTRVINVAAGAVLLEGMMLSKDLKHLKALQWIKLIYVSLPKAAAQQHPPEIVEFLSRIRAVEDVPEPLEFAARVAALRTRFNASRQEK